MTRQLRLWVQSGFAALAFVLLIGCGQQNTTPNSQYSTTQLPTMPTPVTMVPNATGGTTTGTTAPLPMTTAALQAPLYTLQNAVGGCSPSVGSPGALLSYLMQIYGQGSYTPVTAATPYSVNSPYANLYRSAASSHAALNCLNTLGTAAAQMGNFNPFYAPGALSGYMNSLFHYYYSGTGYPYGVNPSSAPY